MFLSMLATRDLLRWGYLRYFVCSVSIAHGATRLDGLSRRYFIGGLQIPSMIGHEGDFWRRGAEGKGVRGACRVV